ncbi:MAG: RuvX/YqgF family protein [Candidatus Taylorbacteria bacterium]|nr:RuvX/YqgF family protein [Candidatus Taylorbacteria bacterium]
MRILGIDYGTKRVGIAVSDEARRFALPVSVIANTRNLIGEIEKIAKANGVKEIVLGESRNYKGEPNVIFDEVDRFKHELERRGFLVYFELEFMTSAQAERFHKGSDKIDASAAALILQSFLDKKFKQDPDPGE